MIPQEQFTQLHSAFSRLSSEEIHALQAFGIQQAGRNGLGRDSRIFAVFGIIGLIAGIASPVYFFVKAIQVIAAIALIAGAGKSYFHPQIRDMLWMVAILGISTVWNAITGLVSMLAFNSLIFAIVLIVLASIEGRWAYSLWQAYRVAKNSDKDFDERYQHVVSLYHRLSEVLGASEPHPDNPIVHFKAGRNSLRIFLSNGLVLLLYRTGMVQFAPAQNIALRPAKDNNMDKLNFDAEMMVNKKVMRGEMSQLSYQTFSAWQDSQS